MPWSVQAPHEYPLTPSEIILLGDDAFGTLETRVKRMLAAAFIANEEVGAIRLKVHSREGFLGMTTNTELQVIPSRKAIEWPLSSLEARVIGIAKRLSGKRKNWVSDIVYTWMSENSNKPWTSASERVKEQLSRRGLVEKIEEKTFLIFTTHHFSTPSSTRDIVSQAPVSLISKMISDFEKTHRVLSKLLLKEAAKGVSRRKRIDNYDPY